MDHRENSFYDKLLSMTTLQDQYKWRRFMCVNSTTPAISKNIARPLGENVTRMDEIVQFAAFLLAMNEVSEDNAETRHLGANNGCINSPCTFWSNRVQRDWLVVDMITHQWYLQRCH